MRFTTVLLSLVSVAFGCSPLSAQEDDLTPVFELFEAELTRRGVEFHPQTDGSYVVIVGGRDLAINLDNMERNYLRDRDPEIIVGFVDSIVSTPVGLPSWAEAKYRVRLALEPSDYDFRDTLREPLSDMISVIPTFVPTDETRLSWISERQLHEWGITRQDLIAAARNNMDDLLETFVLVKEPAQGSFIGFFDTNSVSKASIILAPSFKQTVAAELGWPLLAVVPARDFLFLLPEGQPDLLRRVGSVVVREFNESGHPISPEVLRLSDDGIKAVGRFDIK